MWGYNLWGYIYICEVTFINVRLHLYMWGYIYKCGPHIYICEATFSICGTTYINIRSRPLLRQMAPHNMISIALGVCSQENFHTNMNEFLAYKNLTPYPILLFRYLFMSCVHGATPTIAIRRISLRMRILRRRNWSGQNRTSRTACYGPEY